MSIEERGMPTPGTTLARFLAAAHGHLNGLVLELALAATAFERYLAHGAIASEPYRIPEAFRRGEYVVLFDDPGCPDGSIFSIRRGADQVGAGYVIYGPATVLVLAGGDAVQGFTLDPRRGEFVLTHPELRIPATTTEFAIDAASGRFWGPAVRRYVDECVAGEIGPRGKDFTLRWTGSPVFETHRVLTSGGAFLAPRGGVGGASAVAFLAEQAGGMASTGQCRVLDVAPVERTPLFFGAAEEVARIDRYHRDGNVVELGSPLYGTRGLFRTPA
jgi:fructose-1,6-bisphosphatase I/sedoheptulose-1,7-bisphosphatase